MVAGVWERRPTQNKCGESALNSTVTRGERSSVRRRQAAQRHSRPENCKQKGERASASNAARCRWPGRSRSDRPRRQLLTGYAAVATGLARSERTEPSPSYLHWRHLRWPSGRRRRQMAAGLLSRLDNAAAYLRGGKSVAWVDMLVITSLVCESPSSQQRGCHGVLCRPFAVELSVSVASPRVLASPLRTSLHAPFSLTYSSSSPPSPPMCRPHYIPCSDHV